MARLICACCGNRYGYRDVRIDRMVVRIGEPVPPPRSNLPVIKMECWPALPEDGAPATAEEATAFAPFGFPPGYRIKPSEIIPPPIADC